jgi:DNA-binding response OmpR family regulator
MISTANNGHTVTAVFCRCARFGHQRHKRAKTHRGQAYSYAGLSAPPVREYSLLKAFADHPGQVLSRQELLSMAWDINFDPQTNLVDVYVGYLRRKLGELTIATIRGAGYCLQTGSQAASPNGPDARG